MPSPILPDVMMTIFVTLTVLSSASVIPMSYERSDDKLNNWTLRRERSLHRDEKNYTLSRTIEFSRQFEIYNLGLYLRYEEPAHYLAMFNKQTREAKQLALYAHDALEETRLLSYEKNISRGSSGSESLLLRSSRNHRREKEERCPRRRGTSPNCPSFPGNKYRTPDGTCNNVENPWWGSAMSTMIRFLPAVYHDGIQEIRRSISSKDRLASPRDISRIVHEDVYLPLESVSHLLMQWGQFVDHDITATAQSTGFNGVFPKCCLDGGIGFQRAELMDPDCLPIPVSEEDTFLAPLGVKCLEFVRSSPAPRENCTLGSREQLSQVSSFLDGSMIYGSNERHSESLRSFRDGLLEYGKKSGDHHQSRRGSSLPFEPSDLSCRRGFVSTHCFKPGDGRLSEQPALIALHILFLRLHNGLARKLASQNPHWTDETLYQEARKILGALIQLITYREYLPIVLGNNIVKTFDLEIHAQGFYHGYDPRINPTVVNSFSTAAYRFGHSLVEKSFHRFNHWHNKLFDNVTIHNEFSNRENFNEPHAVDQLILGLVNQPCQRRDQYLTSELTNHLFQTPAFSFGMDLASINIQRGRDHGIPAYTEWRNICGLTRVTDWIDLERVTSLAAVRNFRKVYTSVRDIDLFSGGLAEKPVRGALVGPTFACIIAQQFTNLRKGDRFWFENGNQASSFTSEQLKIIKRITLADILCQTTDKIDTVQPFVLLMPDANDNKRISCDGSLDKFDLAAWKER